MACDWEAVFDLARKREREGDLDEALPLYEKAAASGGSSLVWLSLGHALMKSERWEDARRALLRSMDPDDDVLSAFAWRELGRVYMGQNLYGEGGQAFRRSMELRASSTTAVFLGNSLVMQDREEEALGVFEKALEIDPQCEEAHFNLGLILQGTDRCLAIAHYRKAIDIDSAYAGAYSQLGFCLTYEEGRLDEAETYCRKSIRLDGEKLFPHLFLANILVRRECLEEAESEYRTAIAICPEMPESRCYLAELCKRQGRYSETEELYEQATRLAPGDPKGFVEYAKYLEELGRTREAIDFLRNGLRMSPDCAALRDAFDKLGGE